MFHHFVALDPALWVLLAVFTVVFGCCVGSFLNVCIYRIPLDQSVVKPRSHCMTCGKLIPWYHNLPVISYFWLRGKCANCKAPFSFRYAGVEMLVGFLFLCVFCMYPPAGAAAPAGIRELFPGAGLWEGTPMRPEEIRTILLVPVYWIFLSLLVIGTFTDFDHYIIPDSVTIGGMATGLVLSTLIPEMQQWLVLGGSLNVPPGVTPELVAMDPTVFFTNEPSVACEHVWYKGFLRSLLGLAVGVLPLQAVRWLGTWYFRRKGRIGPEDEAMGFGDIKLIGAIGAFLGWQAAVFCIAFSAMYGSIVALVLLAFRRRTLLSRIPFGPYLCLAALTWVFWGWRLCASYLFLSAPWNISFV